MKNRIIQKLFAGALGITLVLGLTGCGNSNISEEKTEVVTQANEENGDEKAADNAEDKTADASAADNAEEITADAVDAELDENETEIILATPAVVDLDITSAAVFDDSQVDIGITYTIDGTVVNTDALVYNYNFMGADVPAESYAHAELFDINKDGVDEIILKVYGLGNNLEDYAGEMYVYEAAESGLNELFHMDPNETPSGDNLTELVINDGTLYLYTCRKEATDEIELVYTLYQVDDLQNGKLITSEIPLTESNPMNIADAIVF